ncbi:hypothetical protein FSP39_022431 [Pinctada imbricata]|uniref:Methyltransferase domain-containing protein n=1 Tax=Pinctada imbricata TaxID=66713 RepID=A0AA88YFD8_PINIB|nr:hypothetical protein FSP39_022431 [Pinctada imbricata]
MDYRGPYIVAENVASLYNDEQKSVVNILDVGAGTGLAGLELRKFGFTNIDGLEPSKGMLQKAKEKGAYKNLICMPITKDPLDVPAGSYDAITVAGCFGQNHIKCDAIYEMIRLVKPGGYICIATRTENLENVEEYKNRFYPLCDDLEKSGKWKKIKEELCYYQNDREGIVFCFQIC